MNEQTLLPAAVKDAEIMPPEPTMALEPSKPAATAQQMRVVEVTEALAPAYAKASTLELSDSEIEAITAQFPDETVEIRPHDGLIYIPHIFISERLNKVFKPGKWSLVCRRHWMENNVMYGEYVLLIRGCFVGESIGGHAYVPNNPKTNYSDALESTAAEALRRICGKRLSCGSQVWNPEYARQWTTKYSGFSNGKYYKRNPNEKPPAAKVAPAPASPAQSKPAAKPADVLPPKEATEQTRKWMIEQLKGIEEEAYHYAVDQGWILPEVEGLADIPLNRVPTTKEAMLQLIKNIQQWAHPSPDPAATDPNSDEAWRSFPMPFGKHAGVKLGDLEKPYLFGLWCNYTVETEYNGRPKKPETIAKDREFRHMLDMAGQHYQFEKKD